MVIVEPTLAMPCQPGRVGEIWVSGPSIAQGYWDRPDATAESFGAHLPDGRGPFLRTGDLGFLHDDELYVTGRLKELIIIRGRNVYPHDLEGAALVHRAVRPGCGAAFALDRGGEEKVVLRMQQPPPELRARVEKAVQHCPTRALSIEE